MHSNSTGGHTLYYTKKFLFSGSQAQIIFLHRQRSKPFVGVLHRCNSGALAAPSSYIEWCAESEVALRVLDSRESQRTLAHRLRAKKRGKTSRIQVVFAPDRCKHPPFPRSPQGLAARRSQRSNASPRWIEVRRTPQLRLRRTEEFTVAASA